jgi:hypothetical protein
LPAPIPPASHTQPPARPDGQQWLKFDDERVEKADPQKAVEDNWGGEEERQPPGGFGNTFRLARHANAYMLVYVRESEWDAVMCQVSEEDISAHVQARLKVGLDFPLWGSRLPCMRTASLCMSAAGSHAHGQPCSRGPLRTSCAEGLLHSAWPWDAAEPLVRRV